MLNHVEEWRTLVESDELSKSLEKHFNKLGVTDENKKDLQILTTNAIKAVVDDDSLRISFTNSKFVLHLRPPFIGSLEANLPRSMKSFYQVHNGLFVDSDEAYDVSFEICSLDKTGKIEEVSSWCYYFIDDAKVNKDFIVKLNSAGRDTKGVMNIGGYDGQNWYLLHPFKKNAIGEEAIVLFDHGCCDINDVSDDGFPDFLVKTLCRTIGLVGHEK